MAHKIKGGVTKIISWVGLLLLLGVLAGLLLFFYFSRELPTLDEIANRQIAESTKIYDRSGKTLLYEISAGQKRTFVAFETIPKHLKDATLAIEDENFYEEPGFSIRGILRALLVNFTKGQILQGGSTITQQLAKNAFLSAEQTIPRKIKEFLLAIQLNRYYSKDEILNLYLNEIPYGPTIYGVESASQAYFSKSTADLSLAESAILAAIPKAPSYFSPWGVHQKELRDRSHLVLKKMSELGKISDQELKDALGQEIIFAPREDRGIKAPHFVIAVQDYLVQKYGEDIVRTGGLKVVTTLNWDLQQAAEKAVSEGAKRNEELYGGKNAALVSEDPRTGQILALVGSRDYFDQENEGNFNVATQGLRQPGSALKPFVYLTAFENGYTPDTVVFDVPTEFDTTGNPSRSYKPENFDGVFRGPVSLRTALAQSVNIPAVKTLYLVGLREALERINALGISTLTDPRRYGLSLVLGGGEVKLTDMVGAYSVLAEDGLLRPQTLILEVKDSKGKTLESFKESNIRVAEPQGVRLINDILSDVDARAGLFHGSLNLTTLSDHDVALKTGTSNDYRDAWVFGYTPTLVTGVWAGNNNNQPMERRGSSILAALPIWHAFMSAISKEIESGAFSKPEATTAQKPILNGDYLNNHLIHSILYYVDKNNPRGPYPENPEQDPQFSNWETGVLGWARANLPDFNAYNQPGVRPSFTTSGNSNFGQGGPLVQILSPSVGSFVKNPVSLQIRVSSATTIREVNIYLNGLISYKSSQPITGNYDLSAVLSPANLKPQNLLEVEVIDQNDQKSRQSIIVYN